MPNQRPRNTRPDASGRAGNHLLWEASCAWKLLAPCLVGVFCLLGVLSPANADDPSADRHFTLKVLPLLKAKCFACHGEDPEEIKGGLDVRSRAALLRGGDSEEPSIVPGEPEESLLFSAINWQDYEMPPKENDRLTPQQIAVFREWIESGAPWPSESAMAEHRRQQWGEVQTEDGILVSTSGGLADEWTYRRYKPEDIWAFQPVRKPDVPESGDARKARPSHPIDAFIDARRDASGFDPSPQAEPRTLIRRASFDLLGLPPTPQQIEQFQKAWDREPQRAWSELIDRLLESPHYGERWGQHWLDVVRYADTGGYSNDYERSNAWRYRDYVIRSFNEDKPYDQFVIQQIAGDELADASLRDRMGSDPQQVSKARKDGAYTDEEAEWIVATGFLRMGPWDNAMVKAPEARQIYLDDVVNSVGQTFLSTTMRCVKCYDHKFDPIPTRDYYRLYAAFAATQMAERPAPWLKTENQQGFDEGRASVKRMLDFAVAEKNRIKAKQEAAARQWFAERNLEYVPENKRRDLPDDQKPPRHFGLNHVEEGQLKVREQDEWIWTRRLERYQPMVQSVYNGEDVGYTWNGARKLRMKHDSDPTWKPTSYIYAGGSLAAPDQQVSPGVLSAGGLPVQGASTDDPYLVPDDLHGRRLALAKWIADPRNPLTARSIVNRVWQHHFVHALAGNPNNFGAKGAKPTHPQLLDWLAADFVDNGWRLKRLHRLIMTSRAYQQSGRHPKMDQLRVKDPSNRLLAYYPPRRLSAEELRDSLLAVTGELNPTLGGLPVMPEINLEVALQPRMIQFSLAPAYQPSRTARQRNRRTIYAYRVRGLADPLLELFNQPNPNDSCELRDSAAVTPQAFTLLNSDMITDRSIAFALRLLHEADDTRQRIQRAFQLVFGRRADEAEIRRLAAYLAEMEAYHRDTKPQPVVYPTRITRSLVEEFSGKPFEYEEILPVFEDYKPDRKASDVDADTRALADVCLLLFNSNEFVYVY